MTDKKTNEFLTDPSKLAEGLLNSEFIFDPEGTKNPKDYESSRGASYTLLSWKDEFYRWADCYTRLSDDETKRLVVSFLQKFNSLSADGTVRVTTQIVNNIILNLRGLIGIPESRELNTWSDGRERLGICTIACRNGLLTFKGDSELVLQKHTPHYFCLHRLPYDYLPDAECKLWLSFLKDVMLGRQEYIDLLQRWCGYLLRMDLREQKFLLCVGVGANGKGVAFEVIQEMVGKDNCSQVPLARFGYPFSLYSTIGKMVNCTNEAVHAVEENAEAVLKSYVAGDRQSFERKFKEQVSAQPTAKIMIATNALPRFNDKTSGIWRRILLIPFDLVLTEADQLKDLAKELKKELAGILNWSLAGLKILNAQGFAVPEHSNSLMEEYRRDSDPARAFLLDTYEPSRNGEFIHCEKLYNKYSLWCKDNGCMPMNSRTLGWQVKRIFPDVKRMRKRESSGLSYIYEGLTNVQ